jgi:YbgC/YbaW family acyl-CoA thioester hydrolase
VHEHRIQTRWTDFDALGHVTYAAYPVFLDEAREAFLVERVGGFETWPTVVAHFSIDYEREIRYPAAEVLVRTRVADVGRSSVTFEQEVDGAARARTVLVAWDGERRGSRPIGEHDRARLLA